jgi:DNA-binding NtrC family response regulator
MASILIVDSTPGDHNVYCSVLQKEGHTVEVVYSGQQANELRDDLSPDLILLDSRLSDVDGITLLKEWIIDGMLETPVIMMSSNATIESAVEALRVGAVDFLEKPVYLGDLLKAVSEALYFYIDDQRNVNTRRS